MHATTASPAIGVRAPSITGLQGLARWLLLAHAVSAIGVMVVATQLDYPTRERAIALMIAALVVAGLALASIVGRQVRGVAAIVAGAFGIAAGGGFGLAHLLVEGMSLAALLAVPALPAGLALLAAGTIDIVRATPGWWRLGAIPIAFVALQFGLLPLVTATGGAMQPTTALSGPMPDGAEAVQLVAADGAALVAWYTPSRNGAAVILLPGSGGEKGSTLAHSGVLVRNGFGVLALDARGSGESGGVANAWGWRGDLDIEAAVAYLMNRGDVEPGRIGAVGLSMGAEQALGAAGTDPRLRAVVTEGASARTAADVTWLGGDISGAIQGVMYPILWGIVDLLTIAPTPVPLTDAIAASRAPILLIVGNDAAEVGAAPGLAAAGGDRVTVWSLPDTPHIGALGQHPAEWEARVIAFLDASL